MNEDFTENAELLIIPDDQLEFPLWLQKRYYQAVAKAAGRGQTLKKKDYAARLGISDQNFSTYILGKRRPSIEYDFPC